MPILVIFLIALSLSMDAFSLSLAYGTLNLTNKDMNTLSLIIGMYHFFMPILGMILGSFILKFNISSNLIVTVVLCFIGIQMIIESFKEKEEVYKMNIAQSLLFGLAVSIDSFSVGIGIKGITDNYLLSFLIFAIVSMTFTYLGLRLGKRVNDKVGKTSTIIGGMFLIIIGIIYI
jgi:putative Mn2+ efflux pump MntP